MISSSPEFFSTAGSSSSSITEGRAESAIFRYCSLARLRMAFRSFTGIEVEADASLFRPETNTNTGWFVFWQHLIVAFLVDLLSRVEAPGRSVLVP